MSRKTFYYLFACLLFLLPALTQAQSLTRYEYWFDDDFSGRKTGSLSGTDKVVSLSLGTEALDNGIHKFSFRARQSDGKYSAITSSLFLKRPAAQSSMMEYWFDDNFDQRESISISNTEEEQEFDLDLRNNTKYPWGFHKLNMRITLEGGGESAIYSTGVLKLSAGKATTLEYWLDGDRSNIRTLSGSLASDGKDYLFVSDLDMSGVAPGLHRLDCRVVSSSGMTASAVTSSQFLKLSSGEVTTLEYWLDGDRKTMRTISGSLASDGKDYLFVSDLDFGDVSPGHHRLYCRAVSSSGQTASAVTMTPIIVKSRYNISSAETEALTVTEHAYWIDDEEPEVVAIDNPRNVITQPYTFDTRDLTDGRHTLHVQYGNSAGIWNGPVDFPFTKTKVNSPLIAANASVEDGVVTVKYTAIPYGVKYDLVRKYPSGTTRTADVNKSTEYPAALQSTDSPAPGTYTYYIEGTYTDTNGEKQKVRSGEMSVTVEQAASTTKHGRISCVLTIDGERITNPWFTEYQILIDGKNARESGYSYNYEVLGQFTIGDVPVGTEITIGASSDKYQFKDITLVVNENTAYNTYYIKGTTEIEDLQPENATYDLKLMNKIHITPSAWEVEVYNKSGKPWSGNISLLVISKKEKDKYDKAINNESTSIWDIFKPKIGYDDAPLYKTAADMHVTIEGKKTKVLTLDIIDLPEKDRNEAYYVYAFSQRDGTGLTKKLEAYEYDDYVFYPNPQVLEFNPFDFTIALEKGFKSYMKGYAEVMKYVNMISEWGDPFELDINSCKKGFDLWVKSLENGEVDEDELNQDIIDASARSLGMLLNCFFSDMHKSVKKYSKKLKENQVYDMAKGISDFYNTLKKTYDATQVDDNHKFFALAKQVLSFSKKFGADPVLDCYKTYFEVGDAMASAVDRISNKISGYYIWDRLSRGNGIYKIRIRRYPENGEFSGYFNGRDFYAEKGSYKTHAGQIKSITIELVNPSYSNVRSTSTSYDVEIENDGIVIKNVHFTNETDFYTECEAWMTIIWNNNRVTHIPLLDKNFVRLENLNKDVSVPLIMNVELQSETYMNIEGIANQLQFVKP